MRGRIAWSLLTACCVGVVHCGSDDATSPSDAGVDGREDGGKTHIEHDGSVRDGTLADAHGEASSGKSDAGHKSDGGDRDGADLDGAVPDSTVQDGTVQDGTVQDSTLPDSTMDDASTGPRDAATTPDAAATPDATPTDAALDAPLEPDVDAGDSVLRHHKNLNRDGVYVEPALTKAAVSGLTHDTAFSGVLPDPNDHVFAQPLFVDGLGGQDLIVVATAANNVYALNDATTGAQVWMQNVGVPVPLSAKPCGDLDPLRHHVGTPVIDFPSRTLFFDAEVMPSVDGGAG